MRTKEERRMLHSTQRRKLRPGVVTSRANAELSIVRSHGKAYAQHRVDGQDFLVEMKTVKKIREERKDG